MYLFLKRQSRRETERAKNIYVKEKHQLVAFWTLPDWELNLQLPSMCPDWDSNQRLFTLPGYSQLSQTTHSKVPYFLN